MCRPFRLTEVHNYEVHNEALLKDNEAKKVSDEKIHFGVVEGNSSGAIPNYGGLRTGIRNSDFSLVF
ncbi:hypothetical protein TNCV_4281821 [Trichonephila clavipes]|nr:hypothetical protein TNCV_4281821 [Trichonephila clavipes]